MGFTFRPARREAIKARIGLVGVSGSGKTYTALALARGLGSKIAVIDTEHDRSKLYAGVVADFAHLSLPNHDPDVYRQAMDAAAQAGFDVLVIDSLSHAWTGREGLLEQVDKASKRTRGNSFAAWRDITPKHNALIDALLSWPGHVIVTLRAKTEYVIEEDSRGKKVPRKIGMAPVQRDGMEYEFDLVGDLDLEHNFLVSKSRYEALGLDGAVVHKPGAELGTKIARWLDNPQTRPTSKPDREFQPTPTAPAATPPESSPPQEPASGEAVSKMLHATIVEVSREIGKTPEQQGELAHEITETVHWITRYLSNVPPKGQAGSEWVTVSKGVMKAMAAKVRALSTPGATYESTMDALDEWAMKIKEQPKFQAYAREHHGHE